MAERCEINFMEVHDEMWAIRTLASALGSQDEEAQARILRWAWDRYIDQPQRDRMKAAEAEDVPA